MASLRKQCIEYMCIQCVSRVSSVSAEAGKQDCPLLTGVHLWPVTVPGSPAGQGVSMHIVWGLEHYGTSYVAAAIVKQVHTHLDKIACMYVRMYILYITSNT